MKIEINLTGNFCNTWPNLIVELNKNKIYDGLIEENKTINIEYQDKELLEKGNVFVIGMNNKRFGANRQWDTISKDNKIIQDKTIVLHSVKLDDVDCMPLFKNKFHVKRTDRQPTYFPDVVESVDTMNYNGYFTFGFELPLYNSLINSKFKIPIDKDKSYFSNYTKVFHYDEEKSIINSIKEKLRTINEKSGNKRSKVRNT